MTCGKLTHDAVVSGGSVDLLCVISQSNNILALQTRVNTARLVGVVVFAIIGIITVIYSPLTRQ